MWPIKTVTGTIIESSRSANKPMRWLVCNQRHELWLATSHEDERGFVKAMRCICAPMGWLTPTTVLSNPLSHLFVAIACRARVLREFVDETMNDCSLLRLVKPLGRARGR